MIPPRTRGGNVHSFVLLNFTVIVRMCAAPATVNLSDIEDLSLNPVVSVLLIFAYLPDCIQNQTAVSDTLRLLFDF